MTSQMMRDLLLVELLAHKVPIKDDSYNPRYYNRFRFSLEDQEYRLYVQRWCQGRRRFQTHYSRLRSFPDGNNVNKVALRGLLQNLQRD